MSSVYLLVAILSCAISAAAVSEETSVKCGACMMIVTEIENGIRGVDPKKTTTIGSFRIDPKGNQKGLQEIPYARSEVHLSELIDTVCDKAKQYVQAIHPVTGKMTYVHEDFVAVVDLNKKSTWINRLISGCNDLIDDHEADIVKFHQLTDDSDKNPVRSFCYEQLGLCTSVDVTPFPETPETDSHDHDGEL